MSCQIKRKYISRRGWQRILEMDRVIKPLSSPELNGLVCLICLRRVKAPLWVPCLGEQVNIVDNGFYCFQIAPQGECWWLTVWMDTEGQPALYYFDVTKGNIIQGDDSCFDDLMLDVALLPDGRGELLDQDELDAALAQGNITAGEYQAACETAHALLSQIPARFGELEAFCAHMFRQLVSEIDGQKEQEQAEGL